MSAVLQILAAAVGTLGFCLIFNIEKRNIPISTLGGALCWAVFLLMKVLGCSVFPSTFVAAAFVGLYGEVFSRIMRSPTTVYFIPCCVPLIPGSNLYYALAGALSQDWAACRSNAILLVLYAVGIATGLACISELSHIGGKLFEKRMVH